MGPKDIIIVLAIFLLFQEYANAENSFGDCNTKKKACEAAKDHCQNDVTEKDKTISKYWNIILALGSVIGILTLMVFWLWINNIYMKDPATDDPATDDRDQTIQSQNEKIAKLEKDLKTSRENSKANEILLEFYNKHHYEHVNVKYCFVLFTLCNLNLSWLHHAFFSLKVSIKKIIHWQIQVDIVFWSIIALSFIAVFFFGKQIWTEQTVSAEMILTAATTAFDIVMTPCMTVWNYSKPHVCAGHTPVDSEN